MGPFVCLSCKSRVECDDVQVRLTDNPADARCLCVFCFHVDDRVRHPLAPGVRAEVVETARLA